MTRAGFCQSHDMSATGNQIKYQLLYISDAIYKHSPSLILTLPGNSYSDNLLKLAILEKPSERI